MEEVRALKRENVYHYLLRTDQQLIIPYMVCTHLVSLEKIPINCTCICTRTHRTFAPYNLIFREWYVPTLHYLLGVIRHLLVAHVWYVPTLYSAISTVVCVLQEHVITEWQDTSPEFHNEYAKQLILQCDHMQKISALRDSPQLSELLIQEDICT